MANSKCVDEAMQSVVNQGKLLSMFYYPDAILCNSDNVMVLVSDTRNIDVGTSNHQSASPSDFVTGDSSGRSYSVHRTLYSKLTLLRV